MIWQLLEQIPTEQAELAEQLAEWVNNFRLDKIISLTETSDAQSTAAQLSGFAANLPPTHQVMGVAPGQPTYRILVVDDRPENRLLLKTLLQPLGFELSEARTGEEAIEQWRLIRPHLIFMDIRMPGLNGYEATAQIHQVLAQEDPALGPKPVIIALTASVAESEKTALFEAGFDDLMRKPFGEPQLLDRLSHHLGVKYIYQEFGSQTPSPRMPVAAPNQS
ncbi:MAG: response regulator [Prochlorothrix sp.]|nr:response regulator [Prochlorothrix sp.]